MGQVWAATCTVNIVSVEVRFAYFHIVYANGQNSAASMCRSEGLFPGRLSTGGHSQLLEASCIPCLLAPFTNNRDSQNYSKINF